MSRGHLLPVSERSRKKKECACCVVSVLLGHWDVRCLLLRSETKASKRMRCETNPMVQVATIDLYGHTAVLLKICKYLIKETPFHGENNTVHLQSVENWLNVSGLRHTLVALPHLTSALKPLNGVCVWNSRNWITAREMHL